jgi:hypothetical protein
MRDEWTQEYVKYSNEVLNSETLKEYKDVAKAEEEAEKIAREKFERESL